MFISKRKHVKKTQEHKQAVCYYTARESSYSLWRAHIMNNSRGEKDYSPKVSKNG